MTSMAGISDGFYLVTHDAVVALMGRDEVANFAVETVLEMLRELSLTRAWLKALRTGDGERANLDM
jgi:hypothetical protein